MTQQNEGLIDQVGRAIGNVHKTYSGIMPDDSIRNEMARASLRAVLLFLHETGAELVQANGMRLIVVANETDSK